MTICLECKKEYFYTRNKGHTRTVCNSCMANRHRFKKKLWCLEYKGGKCEICGYSKCTRALVFHHLDPSKKEFGIGGSHGYSYKRLKEELDKCKLLCANCHAEVHDSE